MSSIAEQRRELGPYVGMLVFLVAWGMCFASLFFAYSVLRISEVSWPPPGVPRLPLAVPLFNTVVLAISSYTFHRGLVAVRGNRSLSVWLGVTWLLGTLFLALQIWVWLGVERAGLRWDSSKYGSVFYSLTVFHALHVLSGLVVIVYLMLRARRYTSARHTAVRMGAMFWHFVDAVWALMFLTVYVL